jgi:hypothetical protein
MKLRLKLDNLHVESFETAGSDTRPGTVLGLEAPTDYCIPSVNMAGCSVDGYSCMGGCPTGTYCETASGRAPSCNENNTVGCSNYCQGASAFPCNSDTCWGGNTCDGYYTCAKECGGGGNTIN